MTTLENQGNWYVRPELLQDDDLLQRCAAYALHHDRGRHDPRPGPPWPHPDNPMLELLVDGAEALHRSGMELRLVLTHAVVHAWFEGNIEGREQAAPHG